MGDTSKAVWDVLGRVQGCFLKLPSCAYVHGESYVRTPQPVPTRPSTPADLRRKV
jgi:hypothetical protein